MVFRDVLDAISAYTGLSPVAFFTVAALLLTAFYVVSSFLAPPPPPPPPARYEPPPPPVQLGDEVTEAELKAYDGSDPAKPLLMAIKGQIYDVSQSRMFYGPGGPYALFAGKDASRALAKMSFEEADLTGNIEGLNAMELDALQDWEWKFMTKYVKVGQLKSNKSKSSEAALSEDQGQGQDVSTKEGEGENNENPSSEVLSGQVGENGKSDQVGEENGKEKENGQEGQESGLLGSVKDEETQDSSGIKSREVPASADGDSVTSNGTVKPEKQEE